jgi:hypothetical protein
VKVSMVMTGPKISSREHSAPSGTSVSTVGATKVSGAGDRCSAEGGADSLGAGPIQEAADPIEVCCCCMFSRRASKSHG